MTIATPSVLLHKLSQADIKLLRLMLKVEGWIRSASSSITTNGTPALQLALKQFGWGVMVQELLASGARVSEQDADGNTALHVAFVKFGTGRVFDLLMSQYLQETQCNLANKDGLSFVHMACARPYTAIVDEWILDERLDVNCRVNENSSSLFAGYAPLHFAVVFDQLEVAELLLARFNADVYLQDANGSTPLHLALECCDVKMMDLLLAYDHRRENIVNKRGLSHFMVACAGSDELAVKEYLHTASSQANSLVYGKVEDDPGYGLAGYAPLRIAEEFGRSNTKQLLMSIMREMTPVNLRSSPPTLDRHRVDATPASSTTSSESSCTHGNTNVCVSFICFTFELFALAMFLLLILPTVLL